MSENKKEKSKTESLLNGLKIAQKVYTYGGLLGADIAQTVMFDRRASSMEKAEQSFSWRLYKNQTDFPSLAKRKILHFESEGNQLTGYLYENEHPVALLLAVHGFTSCADWTGAAYLDYFVRKGYEVLAIDLTASGRSEGRSSEGMWQSALDVKNCLSFIHRNPIFNGLPIVCLGHSWGAFGVTASLNFDQSPVAVAEMSGYDNPSQLMYSLAENHAKAVAIFGKWQLDQTLEGRAGELAHLSAIDGINKAKKTKVYLLQGELDDVVAPKNCSIYGYQKKIKTHYESRLEKGKKHEGLWFSLPAIEYAESFKKAKKDLDKKYHGYLNAPKEELDAFFNLIDKDKSSEIDLDMLNSIDEFYKKALSKRK